MEQDSNDTVLFFEYEPTFVEMLEMLMEKRLYDTSAYTVELEGLFHRLGYDKESRILDVAAGSGFPALNLVEHGYTIECSDGAEDQIELFHRRARERGVSLSCKQLYWNELSQVYAPETYDAVLCRGNSFIFAVGGWNQDVPIDREVALRTYTETAKSFYDVLKPGGVLYLDKFKDDEVNHKEVVAKIRYGENVTANIVFWTERDPIYKVRRATMLLQKEDGSESGPLNIGYDLTAPELECCLLNAGFSSVDRAMLPSETFFDIYLARK
ncbi:MAG: class I SAM-dependent methyltransferase [Candidatus Uhrbacteria bacterium]